MEPLVIYVIVPVHHAMDLIKPNVIPVKKNSFYMEIHVPLVTPIAKNAKIPQKTAKPVNQITN